MSTHLKRFVLALTFLLMGIILLAVTVDGVFFLLSYQNRTTELSPFQKAYPLFMSLVLTVMSYLLLTRAFHWMEKKQFRDGWHSLFVFLLCMLSGGLAVLLFRTAQYSDYMTFYRLTAFIAEGNYEFSSRYYHGIWAYQTGFPFLMSPVMKLFGTGQGPLLIVNTMVVSVTSMVLHRLLRLVSSPRIAFLLACTYALSPFVFLFVPVYTNQHLAVLCFWSAILLLHGRNGFQWFRVIGAGILMALGHVARPEGPLILLAVYGAALLLNAPEVWKTSLRRMTSLLTSVLLPLLLLLGVFLLTRFAISSYVSHSGINPNGLVNTFPLYKFVVGLNADTAGQFSQPDADHLFSNPYYHQHVVERDEESLRMIQERLSAGPVQLATLAAKKTILMWSMTPTRYPLILGTDEEAVLALAGTEEDSALTLAGKAPPRSLVLQWIAFPNYLIMLLLTGLGMIGLFNVRSSATELDRQNPEKHQSESDASAWPLLLSFSNVLLLIFFMLHLLIEVQLRYKYIVYPAFFVLAAPGLSALHDRWMKKVNGSSPCREGKKDLNR